MIDTILKLVDIETIEEVDHLSNMIDIEIDEDESFCFADGIISHNSAIGPLLNVRDQNLQGGYPLRGKVLNTWDKTPAEMVKNNEIFDILAITGLRFNEEPFEYKEHSDNWYKLEIEGKELVANENDSIFINGEWVTVKSLLK